MKVSIIISNRNDVAMLVVTVRSCIEGLRPLGKEGGEIVICDNSESHIYEILKAALPSGYMRDGMLRLIRQDFPCLFSARETAAKEAKGEYILCLDSHMLVGHDSIQAMTNFMDSRAQDLTLGFAHAPIVWAHQHESRAKHDRDMAKSELGPWGNAYTTERTISWKGMPWICRRSWFLDQETGLGGYGALSKHHVSWGGGDMHIGIKPWLLGFKNWAVPCNPCIHIGPFPKIDKAPGKPDQTIVDKNATPFSERYRLYSSSGEFPHTFGFLVSCYVLGGEPMMKRNREFLKHRFGAYIDYDKWWKKAIDIGQEERQWLLKRQVTTFDNLLRSFPWNS